MLTLAFAALCAIPACHAQAPDLPPGTTHLVPALSDEILHNPGMGIYLQYPPMDARSDEWFMGLSDIAYYRMDWNDLNPEENVTLFDEWFGPRFDFWVRQHGKRVAFRVMCQSMHSAGRYVTPKWVFDRGVPGVTHMSLWGVEQVDPAFWDDRYLDIQCEFIRKLGAYLDGRPGLEFVDIGSIGEWGEMHLARWTSDQFEATGYSEARYVAAYRRIIDCFHEAFPTTPVFLNVGGQNHLSINDYAAINGMHFRQDGLTPSGASYDVGGWLYGPYSRRGVMCNFEFCYGLDEMNRLGLDLKATFDKGLSAPISYLNTNLGDYRTLPQSARDLIADAARRIGYRFVVTGLDCRPTFRVDGAHRPRIPIACTWRNDGTAPCIRSLALEWLLVDAAGQVAHRELHYPETPTTCWWPGEEQPVRLMLRPPASLPLGAYSLRVAMLDPATGRRIMLGLAGRDEQTSYPLADLEAVPAQAQETVIYQSDFEQGIEGWWATTGMTATSLPGEGREGSVCLCLEGTQAFGWNYASIRLPSPVVAGSRVRLEAWMKVESLAPADHPPYLKIAVNRADGSWIENYNTNGYDPGRLGQWQKLEVSPDVAAGAVGADIAVEKGAEGLLVTTRILLDDVRLVMTQEP